MKKIIFLLLLFPLTAISAERNFLDVETAFKNAANFGKTDAQYHIIKYYVSGVLTSYSNLKSSFFLTDNQYENIGNYLENYDKNLASTFKNQYFTYKKIEDKKVMLSCITEQDPDLVMKKIFYKYMDGKIDGKSDFSKEIIEISESYCKEKLNQTQESKEEVVKN